MIDKKRLQAELSEITWKPGWDDNPENVRRAQEIARKLVNDKLPRKPNETPSKFTENEKKETVWMYLNGKNIKTIFEKFNTSRTIVTTILKKYGAYAMRQAQQEELRVQIVADYRAGVPIEILETRYKGMSVRNMLNKHGVVVRKKQRRNE